MQQRNTKPSPGESEYPINVFERSKIRVLVVEDQRRCGHAGHTIEMEFLFDTDDELFRFGVIPDVLLADAIILLQTAHEFVAGVSGVKPLPTVRLNGSTYFVDLRLGEFRNIDDPDDRIAMERSA